MSDLFWGWEGGLRWLDIYCSVQALHAKFYTPSLVHTCSIVLDCSMVLELCRLQSELM